MILSTSILRKIDVNVSWLTSVRCCIVLFIIFLCLWQFTRRSLMLRLPHNSSLSRTLCHSLSGEAEIIVVDGVSLTVLLSLSLSWRWNNASLMVKPLSCRSWCHHYWFHCRSRCRCHYHSRSHGMFFSQSFSRQWNHGSGCFGQCRPFCDSKISEILLWFRFGCKLT